MLEPLKRYAAAGVPRAFLDRSTILHQAGPRELLHVRSDCSNQASTDVVIVKALTSRRRCCDCVSPTDVLSGFGTSPEVAELLDEVVALTEEAPGPPTRASRLSAITQARATLVELSRALGWGRDSNLRPWILDRFTALASERDAIQAGATDHEVLLAGRRLLASSTAPANWMSAGGDPAALLEHAGFQYCFGSIEHAFGWWLTLVGPASGDLDEVLTRFVASARQDGTAFSRRDLLRSIELAPEVDRRPGEDLMPWLVRGVDAYWTQLFTEVHGLLASRLDAALLDEPCFVAVPDVRHARNEQHAAGTSSPALREDLEVLLHGGVNLHASSFWRVAVLLAPLAHLVAASRPSGRYRIHTVPTGGADLAKVAETVNALVSNQPFELTHLEQAAALEAP